MTQHDPYRWNDPTVNSARQLLERVLNDVHWKSAQRYHKRKIIERFTTKISWTGVGVGLFFLLTIYITSRFGLSDAPFSGILVVLAAGLLGASFSVLINTGARDFTATIEELERRTNRSVVFLRLCVGTVGAIMLYFFFEAGLVGGVLLPDLEKIGFAAVSFGVADPEVVADLINRVNAKATLAQSQSTELAALLTTKLDTVVGSDHDKIVGAINAINGHLNNLMPVLMKIADLSKDVTVEPTAEELKKLIPQLHGVRAESDDVAMLLFAITNEARIVEGIRTDIGRLSATLHDIVETASTDGRRHFGNFVPNVELCKLVVWSFIAGFSEQLVANMLRRVENSVPKE